MEWDTPEYVKWLKEVKENEGKPVKPLSLEDMIGYMFKDLPEWQFELGFTFFGIKDEFTKAKIRKKFLGHI